MANVAKHLISSSSQTKKRQIIEGFIIYSLLFKILCLRFSTIHYVPFTTGTVILIPIKTMALVSSSEQRIQTIILLKQYHLNLLVVSLNILTIDRSPHFHQLSSRSSLIWLAPKNSTEILNRRVNSSPTTVGSIQCRLALIFGSKVG